MIDWCVAAVWWFCVVSVSLFLCGPWWLPFGVFEFVAFVDHLWSEEIVDVCFGCGDPWCRSGGWYKLNYRDPLWCSEGGCCGGVDPHEFERRNFAFLFFGVGFGGVVGVDSRWSVDFGEWWAWVVGWGSCYASGVF